MKRGGAHQRRDGSEPEIIDALRKAGAFVVQCHGDGVPDLLVFWRDRWLPIEVKTKTGKVMEKQQRFPIARSAEEALALFDWTAPIALTNERLGILAHTMDAWLRMQGLTAAESLYLLSGLTVAMIETIWEDENNRPRQFKAVVEALNESGFVLGGLITLIKAEANELPE